MEKFILAIDQGTTSTTALLINKQLRVVKKSSKEILPTYPQFGWVEHDLDLIWKGTRDSITDLISSVSPNAIEAIGITNQRETVGAWNRYTGKAAAPAIVWQCRRTTKRCEQLRKNAAFHSFLKKKTGLVLDPYFSATKMEWLMKNIDGLHDSIASGDFVFGNIDTFLMHRLSGNQAHLTDTSNASRTLLMDLEKTQWDKKLLGKFGIPLNSLPEIRPSVGHFTETKGLGFLPDGIPITGVLGDQQAALFGQLCWETGDAKCTYGTGAFLVCNTGKKPVRSKSGLLTTVAWTMNGTTTYALEGSAFVAGALVQFLRDNLGIIKSSSEVEALAQQARPEDMGSLVMVPSLTGLGAPHWRPQATGLISGLTRGTNKAHLSRAALEGIALQNDDLLNAFAKDIKPKKLRTLRVDGGASANNLLIQMQADLAQIEIERPVVLETTAIGAGLAAGLATGFWKSPDEARSSWSLDRKFKPQADKKWRGEMRNKWDRAIRQVLTK